MSDLAAKSKVSELGSARFSAQMQFQAMFMRLLRSCSESINYFRAFPKSTSDCGIQDGHFEGLAGLIFA
jgi:hypothetical protein